MIKPKTDPDKVLRDSTYLHKIRLCKYLPNCGRCDFGQGCKFAHTLQQLQVPDEGPDGQSAWRRVWEEGKVHRWFGQPEMPALFKAHLQIYIAKQLDRKMDVPEWAIGANAWFNGVPPPWPPTHPDFNLAYDIDQLKKSVEASCHLACSP